MPNATETGTKLEHAREWAARGVPVFPLMENSKKPRPGSEGHLEATTDESQIRAWWGDENPEYNIGSRPPPGVLVVDLDVKDDRDGIRRYEGLGGTVGGLVVRTPTGGLHVFVTGPDLLNSAGKLDIGVDTRGQNGYTVAPGSTINGVPYELISDGPMLEAPAFIAERIRARPVGLASRVSYAIEPDLPSHIAQAVEVARRAEPAVSGLWHELGFKLGCELCRVGLSLEKAVEVLLEHWVPRGSGYKSYDQFVRDVAGGYNTAFGLHEHGMNTGQALALSLSNVPIIPADAITLPPRGIDALVLPDRAPLLDKKDPSQCARMFLGDCDVEQTLGRRGGAFFCRYGSTWRPGDESELNGAIRRYLDVAQVPGEGENDGYSTERFKPTQRHVNAVRRALLDSILPPVPRGELIEAPPSKTPAANLPAVVDPNARILNAAAPRETAKAFLDACHREDGVLLLRSQEGSFLRWVGTHYAEKSRADIDAEIGGFLDESFAVTERGAAVPFNPTISKVENVLHATAALCHLPSDIRSPAWLGGQEGPPAKEVVSCTNCLLHPTTGETFSHSPAFFTRNALPYAYDPNAPTPESWLAFLADLWPDDTESQGTLQEIFGLMLTAETRYQKAFLIQGVKRSGKGTIGRVLKGLIGEDNHCGPTLDSLAKQFGLAPLIGKRLALIPDARWSGKEDAGAVVERILSVTGEDALTIDRKFRDPWTGKLDARFLVFTNELPNLKDASGAFASRFITLRLQRSFYGQEDHGLTNRLIEELPGILNWALEGWRRLEARGYILQPASGLRLREEWEALGSPILAFLEDCCEVAPGKRVKAKELFDAYRVWGVTQGRSYTGTVQTFGRDLQAAVPGLQTTQPRAEGKRDRHYEGVALREPAHVDVVTHGAFAGVVPLAA